MGRLTPAITSMSRSCITEMARLDGVPPNMSVRITTPLPVIDRLDGRDDVVAPPLHVVIRPDTDGGDALLRANDVFKR